MTDPKYPPPRFAVPIDRADCYKCCQPDGTVGTRYVPVCEELFAAAVAALGSHWPRPARPADRPAPTLPHVHMFRRFVPVPATEQTYTASFTVPIDSDQE